MTFRTIWWLGCLSFTAAIPAFSQNIIINEIMYRPAVAGAGTVEEWIELHNRGATNVNLNGWQITAGVSFRFSNNVTIPAGGYYVIAANRQSFGVLYSNVNNVVGNWTGTLNNNGENIELTNPAGEVIDEVRYATEGDWAIRRRGPLLFNHRGWVWYAEHDGGGKSLELVNPGLPNESGQNWAASGPVGGSPGARNSVHSTNVAPLILEVSHSPLIPTSSDSITVNARFADEGSMATPVVWWRTLANPFTSLDMFDDGEHNDGSASDGVYGALLPPHADRTVVEFYVEARDVSSNVRTWPAAALDEIGFPGQGANALCQVDDGIYAGDQPVYRVIMTEVERLELERINSTSGERNSDALMNATFVTIDPVETLMRYQCGFRIRGAGSRGQNPPNNRLNIPNDRKWKGIDRLSLNCQFTHSQLIGSIVAKRAGLNVADARLIQMRINGRNPANAGLRQFGSYVAVEVMNSDWAADEFPNDPDGNIYRASTGNHSAGLTYIGQDYQSYLNAGYTKESNGAENDWADLINLTFLMSSNTPPEQYVATISQVINIRPWMTYFATLVLMEYSETSLGTGRGDDYSMYRGINDPRFLLIGHDFDTIFAQGDTGGNISQSIFMAVQGNNINIPAVQRFLTNSALVPLYYEELHRLATTTFSTGELFPIFDRYLTGWVPADRIAAMKTFATARTAYVLSQIPLNISVTPALPIANGYFQAPGSTVNLSGRANVIRTRLVLVNSSVADWNPMTGVWTVTGLPLNPGVNRVVISTYDQNGIEFETRSADVWYDIGSLNPVSGAIGTSTTWIPAAGPYFVSGTLQINAPLTIDAGTSVYLAPSASIEVTSSGRLVANGTSLNRIRFTRRPGTTGNWGEIFFNGSGVENRLVNVDIEHSGAGGRSLRANNAVLYFDGISFTNTLGTYCALDNSAFIVRNSGFPSTIGAELFHGTGIRASGYGIIESNVFGTTTGLNDIIDFTGGQRPGPILQVLNNIFTGASDDVLDLDGADAHVEGNVFMNVHQETPGGDTASAISGGADSGNTSEITIARNFFYDCDYAALAKEGNFYTIVNNTMVNLTHAAVNFDEPLRPGIEPGRGAYFDGNIVRNTPADFANVTEGFTELTVLRSILSASADPKLVRTNATLATITNDLSPRPGSIAMGAGPNGQNIGAAVPAGASISGEPISPSSQNSATLTVGGPGITHYRYNVNGGGYSLETPVSSPIVLNGLADGTYSVSVAGKNSAGVYQTFNTFSRTWIVDTVQSQVRLNEVLARNENILIGGETPDVIELYNSGNAAVDLSGMGVTDDPAVPKKFSFAAGTSLGPRQYMVLYADEGAGHLGFGLNQNGDGVWLFNANATLRDSITFGFQAADHSIGRNANGSWVLTRPTFGGPNIAQPPADPHYVKINEWLASARVLHAEDFVELHNPEPTPADMSGVYFSDAPQAAPMLHQVAPLSFIGGYGFLVLTPDGNTNAGPEHLSFGLSSDQGEIAMFASDGSLIDCITYGPQTPDVSEGRRPNGGVTIAAISPPTPNAPNPALVPGVTVSNVVTTLLPMDAFWKYEPNGNNLGTAWRAPTYDDSGWLAGPGMLADESPGVLPPPGIGTALSINGPNGFVVTFYFRTEFIMPETNMPGATLTASLYIDDGAVIYINGVEVIRRRMNNLNQTYTTLASQNQNSEGTAEVFTLSTTNFQPGINYIAAEVHQGGLGSSDVVFGMSVEATHLVTNFPPRGLVFNEVMANNVSVTNTADNTVSDWVEFLNPSTNTLDLGSMSISDDIGDPWRWVFPPGVTLGPSEYLIVKFDSALPPSTNAEPVLNTGFGLSAGGDQLFLFARPEDGGDVLDSVAFGIQAADFTISRVPEVFGAWRLSFPTLRSIGVPTALGSPGNLRLNEWLAAPSGNDNDFFELYNPEPQPVELSGLHLSDNLDDRTQHRIPPLSFIGVGEQGFAEFIADGDPEDGANHVNFRLSAGGEALGVYTASGGVIDTLTFDDQANGISEGRFPDGADVVDRFPETSTPGASNMRRLTSVVINEVLSHTDLPLKDAIELFNPTGSSVDISGWFLSDRRNDPRKFKIPDGTLLPAGGFIVFDEDDFNPTPGDYPSFALSSAEGEDLFLFGADEAGRLTGYRADVEFGAAENGVTFGQYETSIGFDFTALSQRTLGAANAYPKIGPVVITEIMYRPPDLAGEDNVRDEFIELLNISGAPLPLYDVNFPTNTWRLRDAVDFNFPPDLTLPVNGYLVLVGFDPATNATQVAAFRTRHSIPGTVPVLGPFDGRLANDNENVELYKPDAPNAGLVPYVQVDKVRYRDSYPWASAADGNTNGIGMSLQRRFGDQYGNDPVNWLAAVPTAGGPTATVSASVPAIAQQPQSRTVVVNAATSFSVTTTGLAPLRYQWRFNGVDIPRATNATFAVPSAQIADNGAYSVLVVNSLGAVLSARATLTVQTPATIIGHPQDRLVPPGETAIFTVTAQGTPPLRYQWRFNGVEMTGETNAILTISNVQTNKEGLYSVQVSNPYGTNLSQSATLTVRSIPIIVTHPQGTNVFTGSTVTFQVSAFGTAPLRYFWRFNDNAIPNATNTSLTLTNVQLQNAGAYTVLITNNIGGTLSSAAILTVTVPPVATVAAFDSTASENGDVAVFTLTRTGTLGTPLDIFFTVGGTAQPGSDYFLQSSPVRIAAGAASVQLTLTPVNDGQRESQETVIMTVIPSGQYIVGASAAATATIADDDNSIPQVQISSPADNARFTAPTNVTITAIATDADGPPSRIEFFANLTNKIGEDLTAPFSIIWTNPPVGNHSLTARATDDVGATAVSAPVRIVLATAGFADLFAHRGVMAGYTNYFTGTSATYIKEAGEPRHHHNGNGNGTRSAWLSWTAPSPGTVTMNCVGSAFDTVMVIYTNSNPAAPTLANLVRVASNDDLNASTVTSQVIFDAVAGVTYQVAIDGYVAGVGGALVFRMNLPNPNPVILTNPANQLVNPGANVTFSVVAGGPGPFRYQWRFGDSDVPNATNANLTINNAQAANQGIYAVLVSNGAGSVASSPATLALRPPPSITTPLVNRIVNPGSNTSFTVGVSGTGPFTYQWRYNGSMMPGATSATLFRNTVQHAQGGMYQVTVSNAAGSTSSQAELIVRPVLVSAAISNSILILTLEGTPGKTYSVQTGTNLTDWADIGVLTPSTLRSEYQTPITPTNRLFRLRVP